MKKSNKFVWEEGDIRITKPAPKKEEDKRCSRCGIPDFLALNMKVIGGKDVCEECLTPAEQKRILRERYAKLGLDDSELNKKG